MIKTTDGENAGLGETREARAQNGGEDYDAGRQSTTWGESGTVRM